MVESRWRISWDGLVVVVVVVVVLGSSRVDFWLCYLPNLDYMYLLLLYRMYSIIF